MSITKYLFHVVGEDPDNLSKWHRETINRTKAFGIAIHIPVLLWAITGYVITFTIFNKTTIFSGFIALFCAGLIYLVERIVLATPKKWSVNILRVLLGFIIAVLGAFTIDLVVFDKEVSQELRKTVEARINNTYEKQLINQSNLVLQKKNEWFAAQSSANCEANGECGSKTKSLGPIYRALKEQADLLRDDYEKSQADYEAIVDEKNSMLEAAKNNILSESGLLTRIQTLHQYTNENKAALFVWSVFFALVLFLELTVVMVKLQFSETVDDQIEKWRADVSRNNAKNYLEAVTSPLYSASKVLHEAVG